MDELYHLILLRAKDYANFDNRLPDYLKRQEYFRLPPNYNSLALSYEVPTVSGHIEWARLHRMENRSVEEVLATFTPIITDAIKQALVETQHEGKNVFAALIVEKARQGDLESFFHDPTT